MSFQSECARRWQSLRQVPGRVPLRIKLITALLALVAIALAAMSIAGISFLRGYLLGQSDETLVTWANQARAREGVQTCLFPRSRCQALGPGQAIDWVPAGGKLQHVVVPVNERFGVPSQPVTVPGPSVQAKLHWLTTHPNKPVTVPAESGGHRWRVVAFTNTFFAFSVPVRGTVIAGVDVTGVYNTLGKLVSIDLFVSAIVVVSLAVVGVAIVRSSLRPLSDIERTAAAIAGGELSRRVPDRDPRTEVGRLGRALNAMLAQIEAAFHARAQSEAAARRSEERMRRFVADASHELRTPLTAIRGYAEYYRQRGGLEKGARADPTYTGARAGPTETEAEPLPRPAAAPAGPREPETTVKPGTTTLPGAGSTADASGLSTLDLDRIMERVEQESARMGMLVEDMLLLARVDQQRPIELRPVDLLTLAADAVQDARMIAPRRTIDLTVGAGAAFLVLGDEPRLRQVIGNLMGNALTHTPDDTPIDVRIQPGGMTGDPPVPAVRLEVADRGHGMTAEQAEHAFERFYRADQARGRRTGGTGLGLAIVSALVTTHGGSVGVDTAPGKGATFHITLPLAPEAQEQAGDA